MLGIMYIAFAQKACDKNKRAKNWLVHIHVLSIVAAFASQSKWSCTEPFHRYCHTVSLGNF
jgi:hypothetical protein